MISRSRRIRGFTLMELVVAVAIIALLSGAGLTVFLNFRDNRAVLVDARLVEQGLREAQRKAAAGERPVECGGFPLSGYQVRVGAGAIYIRAVCPGGMPPETIIETGGSTLSGSPATVVFGTIRGGATQAVITVCRAGVGIRYQILVGSAGAIEAPIELLGSC